MITKTNLTIMTVWLVIDALKGLQGEKGIHTFICAKQENRGIILKKTKDNTVEEGVYMKKIFGG